MAYRSLDLVPSFFRWPNFWDDEDWPLATGGDNLDIYETEDEVVVRASVAGVKAENVDLTFEKGVLSISAQEEVEQDKDKKYYRKSSRSYSYRVSVPGNVDVKSEPGAEVKDGVLSVRFKKSEEAKPKKIAVKGK